MGMTVQFKDQWAADDRLFEASWRAVQGELKRRALRRAKGNLDQGGVADNLTNLLAVLKSFQP